VFQCHPLGGGQGPSGSHPPNLAASLGRAEPEYTVLR
jgi:hypothetical protein